MGNTPLVKLGKCLPEGVKVATPPHHPRLRTTLASTLTSTTTTTTTSYSTSYTNHLHLILHHLY